MLKALSAGTNILFPPIPWVSAECVV